MSAQNLTVEEMPNEDHWKDMARIPGAYRIDNRGKWIKGAVCKITIGDKQKILNIRGWDGTTEAVILLDRTTRTDLGVGIGRIYKVEIRRVCWLGYVQWAWRAADPVYRVPVQISIISLILGMIGLIFGLISLCR